jgi:multidrug efflux pump subunit AcrB
VGITADHVDTSDPITEDQENSFGAMGLVFILSIFTIACLLVVQFRSLLLPGVILMAVPLALPLLFPGLLSVGADLSFFVMLGISALIGIAVNNSIMLIDYANQEIRRGAEPVAAIMEALHIRFRPLVIAALTTVVGVYPLTTDPQFSGLAWTVIFGLVSSTVLVVTVFPAYYVMVQTPRSAVARWRHRRRDSVSA